jgi:TPR repeat protein
MASHFHTAWNLQKQGLYDECVRYYESALQAGDQKAKFHLNCMYTGQGIPQKKLQWSWDQIPLTDLEVDELLQYYSEHNSCQYIQNNMGILYIKYKKDVETGIKWYKLSAEQGYILAMNNLGLNYRNLKNYEEAHKWLLMAGSRGHSTAQYVLGELYFQGEGGPKDYKIAYTWYSMAASQNHTEAEHSLGWLYHEGLGVEQNFEKAREWYLKSANKEHVVSQNNLGYIYRHGQGVEPNLEGAFEWYLKGANQGYWRSQFNLALLYEDKNNPYHNYLNMMQYLKLSADQNYQPAIKKLEFYTKLPDTIQQRLQSYLNKQRNEGISYLFFSNFLFYLNSTIEPLNWNDPMLRSWVANCLVEHFKHIEKSVIESWYDDFYG